jgi:micrococcal nuclease
MSNFPEILFAVLLSVTDGDTIKVRIPNIPTVFGEEIAVRIAGIDTPESNSKCAIERELAKKATEFTKNFLQNTTIIELQHPTRDMYFRVDADIIVEGKYLSKELLNAGLAKPYFGGIKTPWCNIRDSFL